MKTPITPAIALATTDQPDQAAPSLAITPFRDQTATPQQTQQTRPETPNSDPLQTDKCSGSKTANSSMNPGTCSGVADENGDLDAEQTNGRFFVTLHGGLIVPAAPYVFLLDLEGRGFTVARDADMLVVRPADRLTRDDCANCRRWKFHLLMLLDYCARPGLDAHLFTDAAGSPPSPRRIA